MLFVGGVNAVLTAVAQVVDGRRAAIGALEDAGTRRAIKLVGTVRAVGNAVAQLPLAHVLVVGSATGTPRTVALDARVLRCGAGDRMEALVQSRSSGDIQHFWST